MAYFNDIRGEGNMVGHSSLRKWKSWQEANIRQSCDLRIGPKRNFRFQKNYKQPEAEVKTVCQVVTFISYFFKIFAYNFL